MKKFTSILFTFIICMSFFAFAPALAQDTFGTGLVATELSTTLGTRDIRSTVADIINVALGLLGIVAVVIMLIGGFEWMTAGGNEDKVADARKRIFAGIIGLAIIMSSWALTSFVLQKLQDATLGNI